MELLVVPLHRYPEYVMDCCKLINDEWKRSDTARIHSLEMSCDQLPTSLILLEGKTLIGHLKLTPIPSIKDSCFIESVIIHRKLRGQGHGTFLMNRAEEYCKSFLGINTIYLSTKGQEPFYSKLGYIECLPISIYGSYTPKPITPQQKNEHNVIKNIPPPPPLPVNTTRTTVNSRKSFMMKRIQ